MGHSSDSSATPEWLRGDLPAEPDPEAHAATAPEADPAAAGDNGQAADLNSVDHGSQEGQGGAAAAAASGAPALPAGAAEPMAGDGQPTAAPEPAAALPQDEPAIKAPEPPLEIPMPPGDLSLAARLEALLFVADGPVPVARLAEALEVSPDAIESGLEELTATYQERGLSLQRWRDRVQLTTAPGAAAAVERFLGLAASSPLSKAALETLAIVAYQQPVTRPQIDAVRGVNSDSVIKNLLSKGLIEEVGRAEGPGRPVLYSTTPEFMQHFGLASLGELPALPRDTEAPAPSPAPEEILKG